MALSFLTFCCFKSLKDSLRPMFAHHFSNKKAWMDSNIMESILSRLDPEMCLEKRKVVFFGDNATCHPETLQASSANITFVFLPKNTISRLQPLDAAISSSCKYKYRKLLVRHVVSHIDEGRTASQIIELVHVLKAITWLQTTWKSVSTEIIKKFRFDVEDMSAINEEIDIEFQSYL